MTLRLNRLIASEYSIASEKIGKAFDGFTFAYLADLHDVCVGENNSLVIENIRRRRPDAILLGGDMITERKHGVHMTECRHAMDLVIALAALAPVYYSIGNHEVRWMDPERTHTESFADYKKALESAGVRFLDNRSAKLHRGNDVVRITGLSLPLRYFGVRHETLDPSVINMLAGDPAEEYFQILLGHSPTHHKAYDAWGADLSLSGHYHGGQVRLPFLGGVISTGWTLFPKYDMGMYDLPHGKLIVSAGLGTHTIPLRINNPPEAVYITLTGKA